MNKEIYNSPDGIYIWKHLLNNKTDDVAVKMKRDDYGKLAENIGKRQVRYLVSHTNLISLTFPDVNILSVTIKHNEKFREYGDICYIINYQSNKDILKYGKKLLLFEIKHGKTQISQNQIKKYSKYIINPSAYFRKADEVKIIFMFFSELDTLNATATYSFCEFIPSLADKIANAIPKKHENINENIFLNFNRVME